jgi:proline dehydrogenase
VSGLDRIVSASVRRRALFALATSERWERAVRATRWGERVAFRRAKRYVAGTRAEDAFAYARRLASADLASSIDFFGESVVDPREADAVADAYVQLVADLDRAPRAHLSLDLSHLGLDLPGEGAQARLERIAAALPSGRRIQIGAEDERRADRILETVLAAARGGAPVLATVQANLIRARADAASLAEAGVPIRLCKGAYVEDADIARPWGEPTDHAFLELAHDLHGHGAEVVIATHDPGLREGLLRALPGLGVEMLLGVHEDDARELARRGVGVRVYVPYGDGWFRYAMRRWAESVGH